MATSRVPAAAERLRGQPTATGIGGAEPRRKTVVVWESVTVVMCPTVPLILAVTVAVTVIVRRAGRGPLRAARQGLRARCDAPHPPVRGLPHWRSPRGGRGGSAARKSRPRAWGEWRRGGSPGECRPGSAGARCRPGGRRSLWPRTLFGCPVVFRVGRPRVSRGGWRRRGSGTAAASGGPPGRVPRFIRLPKRTGPRCSPPRPCAPAPGRAGAASHDGGPLRRMFIPCVTRPLRGRCVVESSVGVGPAFPLSGPLGLRPPRPRPRRAFHRQCTGTAFSSCSDLEDVMENAVPGTRRRVRPSPEGRGTSSLLHVFTLHRVGGGWWCRAWSPPGRSWRPFSFRAPRCQGPRSGRRFTLDAGAPGS